MNIWIENFVDGVGHFDKKMWLILRILGVRIFNFIGSGCSMVKLK